MRSVKTVSVRDLEEGVDYDLTHFDWIRPYETVKARIFSKAQRMQTFRCDEYFDLEAERMNVERGTDKYIVASKEYGTGDTYEVSVIKLLKEI